ncbi:hypothetical protein ACTHTG_10485 [Neisseria sp. P0017.S009]
MLLIQWNWLPFLYNSSCTLSRFPLVNKNRTAACRAVLLFV